jgi:hypothetical protein
VGSIDLRCHRLPEFILGDDLVARDLWQGKRKVMAGKIGRAHTAPDRFQEAVPCREDQVLLALAEDAPPCVRVPFVPIGSFLKRCVLSVLEGIEIYCVHRVILW